MADLRTLGQLDDFERPAETPLSFGGKWAHPFPGVTGQLRLTANASPPYNGSASNDPAAAGTGADDLDYSYWTPDMAGNDCEIWGYPTGGEAGAALTGWRLGFFMANSIPGAAFSGYLFVRATALGDFMLLRRYDSGGFTDIATGTHEGYSPLLLFRRRGSVLEAWHCTTMDGTGTWTLIVSASDGTYQGPFRLVIGIEDDTNVGTGWLAIGGGGRNRTQIYRLLHN